MKSWLWIRILAVAVAFLASTGAAFAQDKSQKQQGIEGVWDVRVAVIDCTTSATLVTGRAISLFIDGGALTEITDNHLHPSGLGAWHHIRGQSYTATDYQIIYNADGSFAGSQKIDREIELSTNGNEYTGTATVEIFNAADQLISTGCATSAATRLD